jgi:mannosyl-oligosaccharide glucosidase
VGIFLTVEIDFSADSSFDLASFLDTEVPALLSSYDKRFESTFPVPPSYVPSTLDRESLERFSKAITANLLGGVGYFYGTSIVDKDFSYEWDAEDAGEGLTGDKKSRKGVLTEPTALLTATPSRSFFPRGFYW